MFVCLQLGDDRHHELEVDQSWTIKELKQALHDLSTSFDQQQLCVNGIRLEDDDKTLADYGISDATQIQVQKPAVPKVQYLLLLMTAEVGPVRVTLDSDKTVDQLKKIIAKELEIPMEKQELYSAGSLLTHGTLSSNKLKSQSVILIHQLDSPNIPIHLKMMAFENMVVDFSVKPDSTIASLKEEINFRKGLHSRMYTLHFKGEQIMDSKRSLHDYSIASGSTIELHEKPAEQLD